MMPTGMSLMEMTLGDLSPFANHLWQSTLCVVAIWLLTVVLRKNHAAVRYWLWLTASVKFLIPFSLLVGMGSQVGRRTAPAIATAIAEPHWSSVVADVGGPFTASAAAHRAVASPVLNSLPGILFMVWLCGFAVSIILWLRCWRQMRAVRKGAVPLALGLQIPAMSSSALLEPGVFGVRHPVLLLPKGIVDRLTPAQLNAVLAHEMCHVRRRDNLTAAIHMAVEAIFWFYPLAWWIRARLIEERERACDEAVLQLGSDAEVYAEGILTVCKFYVESPVACVSGISGSDLKKRIVRIMTERFAYELTFGRKLLLTTLGIAAIILPAGFGLLNVTPSRAQSQAPDSNAAAHVYEVASIRPDKSGDPRFQIDSTPNGFTANTTLQSLIRLAYGVEDNQISGAPKWVNSDKYKIEAKMDGATAAELDKLSDDQSEPARRRMLQALLEDRFKLMLHRETKELPVYSLVVAKDGPKLQEAKPGEPDGDGRTGPDGRPAVGGHFLRMGRGQLNGHSLGMKEIVRSLSEQLGRTVVDRTGLTGNYDFSLQWTPDEGQPSAFKEPVGGQGPASTPPADSSGPTIFTAIQEQLGLKLESQKGPVEILIIDHAEKPSAN
jgi:bla regulator protein blaR1